MPDPIKRRQFLDRLCLAAGGALFRACGLRPTHTPAPPPAPSPQPTPGITPSPDSSPQSPVLLTFLYTGDTHGHLAPFRSLGHPKPIGGIARRAAMVRQIREQARRVLLVDAGDVHHGRYQSSLMADAFQGEPDIALMNELGYVAMGLGNHDVGYGWQTFQQRQEAAFFPILCANLVHGDSEQPVLDTHAIVERGGLKIALTSLASPTLWRAFEPSSAVLDSLGMAIRDPVQAARALIPQLKQQADLVVILGHQSRQEDYALANAVQGIHIIIGAYEQPGGRLAAAGAPPVQGEAVQIAGTIVVRSSRWGAHLGRLDVDVLGDRITAYGHDLIPLTADLPTDPDIEARVGTLQAELRQLYPDRFAQIGQAAADISDQDIKLDEAPLGNLVCDVVRQKTQAQVSLIASATMFNALFAGPIFLQDLYNALPDRNEIVTLRLSGEQLQQALDLSASASGMGSFSQVSGVRLRIIGGVATEVTVNDQPLDMRQLYTIATTAQQLQTRSAGYRDLFAAGQDVKETGTTIKEALMDHIRMHSPIHAEKDGRIAID